MDGEFRRLAQLVGCGEESQRKIFVLEKTKDLGERLVKRRLELIAALEAKGRPVPTKAYYDPPDWYHEKATRTSANQASATTSPQGPSHKTTPHNTEYDCGSSSEDMEPPWQPQPDVSLAPQPDLPLAPIPVVQDYDRALLRADAELLFGLSDQWDLPD